MRKEKFPGSGIKGKTVYCIVLVLSLWSLVPATLGEGVFKETKKNNIMKLLFLINVCSQFPLH